MPSPLQKVLGDQRDLLLFRPFKPDMAAHGHLYLGWGCLITWLAGVGRYWDHPNAELWQYLGLGSVAYVVVLALIVWAVAAPLRPANWSYETVLVFVMLTSLPAILYAIPVEKLMSLQAAQMANVMFLAIVASWRVALLIVFLRRVGRLDWLPVAVAALLPLALIVTLLVALNLEKAVFEIMGGNRQQTQNDAAYAILILISVLSVCASPLLLIAYGVLIYKRWQAVKG